MIDWFTSLLWRAIDFLQTYNGAVTAAATVFIAVFTVVLSIVSRRQAILTRDSVRIAERALTTAERAFVFVEDFDPDVVYGFQGSGADNRIINHLAIRPRWRNNGNTPTKNMAIIVNWTPWPTDLPEAHSYAYGEGVKPSPMFLGPRATEWSEPIKIPANVATDALKGRQVIFIWGRATYNDIFDGTPEHFTRWCYKLVFTRTTPLPLIQFVAFGPYNGSDEDTSHT
jgi:hypothetical protein